MADTDVIVIGSGHNALICALSLARAGLHPLVLEHAAEVGGGMRTAEITLPEFKHDLFATNVGRFALSPVYQQFRSEFDALGIRFLNNKLAYASVYPGGRAARAYVDMAELEREIASFSRADLEGWKRALEFYHRTTSLFSPLQQMMLPSMEMVRQIARIWAKPADAMRLTRMIGQTPRQYADRFFQSPYVKGLVVPWAFHSDFGPDDRGGATYAFIAGMSAQHRGITIAEGGAGRITAALRTLIEKYGGSVRTGSTVKRILVRDGRAAAVETATGETMSASRAIIASVSTTNLFGGLVQPEDLSRGFYRRAQRFSYGIGTFVVHMALGGPLQWRDASDLGQFNTVHINSSLDDLTRTYNDSLASKIPSRPLLIVSQPSQPDPTRAPPGQHVARIHSRALPGTIVSDAAGQIVARDWDGAKEAVADRLIGQLAEHTNVRDVLLARHAVSPLDLERGNPNWIGGDCGSGSHHLHQNYFFRPLLGWSRYRTPIGKLYMIGSSTWPGGGIQGTSGYLLAQQLVA